MPVIYDGQIAWSVSICENIDRMWFISTTFSSNEKKNIENHFIIDNSAHQALPSMCYWICGIYESERALFSFMCVCWCVSFVYTLVLWMLNNRMLCGISYFNKRCLIYITSCFLYVSYVGACIKAHIRHNRLYYISYTNNCCWVANIIVNEVIKKKTMNSSSNTRGNNDYSGSNNLIGMQ